MDIKELLGKGVAVIAEQLLTLDKAQLVELQAAEVAGSNRRTLLAAIDERLKALDEAGDPEVAPKAGAKLASKATDKPAAAPAPKWQSPDYHGPLSGEQAAWRVANIKPVTSVRTK